MRTDCRGKVVGGCTEGFELLHFIHNLDGGCWYIETLAPDEIFSPCNKTVLTALIISWTLSYIIPTLTGKK